MQNVNVHRMARVIGQLTDQISDDDPFHSRRVAVMAWRIARKLGLGEHDLNDLLVASLIHDCGVSSPSEHTTIVTSVQWQTEGEHCQRGADYLANCLEFNKYCAVVRYHHMPWDMLKGLDIPSRDKQFANILYCADRCYVAFHRIATTEGIDHVINYKSDMIAFVDALGSEALSRDISMAFKAVARTDGFWLALYPDFLDSTLSPLARQTGNDISMSFRDMRHLATLISRLVDAKSHFTHEHSERVALICRYLCGKVGIAGGIDDALEIAALLHDVGKQQAPEALLLKDGALTDQERAVIKRHTIGSEITLEQLFPDSPIVKWAASHHEKLDGSGYPYGLMADEIDIHTRILTTADIFQALSQDRPYRGRLTAETTLSIMSDMVEAGELDRDLFSLVQHHGDEIYRLSTGK